MFAATDCFSWRGSVEKHSWPFLASAKRQCLISSTVNAGINLGTTCGNDSGCSSTVWQNICQQQMPLRWKRSQTYIRTHTQTHATNHRPPTPPPSGMQCFLGISNPCIIYAFRHARAWRVEAETDINIFLSFCVQIVVDVYTCDVTRALLSRHVDLYTHRRLLAHRNGGGRIANCAEPAWKCRSACAEYSGQAMLPVVARGL